MVFSHVLQFVAALGVMGDVATGDYATAWALTTTSCEGVGKHRDSDFGQSVSYA